MLKKIILLLFLWIIFPSLFIVQAQEQDNTNKENTVSVLGDIVPKVDKNGNMVISGQVKSNSKDLLHSVEIVFDFFDSGENILESRSVPIMGNQEGVLEEGETGSFVVITSAPISSVKSYKYNIHWKTFAK